MFNLLVMNGGWPLYRSSFPRDRLLEYTTDEVRARINGPTGLNLQALISFPCLFMSEQGSGDNLGRVGTISRLTAESRYLTIEYSFDAHIPPFPVSWIGGISDQLQMQDWEFTRTHWAVKDVDLHLILLRTMHPRMNRPKVFTINETPNINSRLMSAMMPFDGAFDAVYQAIQRAGSAIGLAVQRADDIWNNDHIIQDIVSLIDGSQIVVADCTGKNANVFYEIGIAHTLGRDVILITQNMESIPFDLRHLRAITYLNNGEGLQALEAAVKSRAHSIVAQS